MLRQSYAIAVKLRKGETITADGSCLLRQIYTKTYPCRKGFWCLWSEIKENSDQLIMTIIILYNRNYTVKSCPPIVGIANVRFLPFWFYNKFEDSDISIVIRWHGVTNSSKCDEKSQTCVWSMSVTCRRDSTFHRQQREISDSRDSRGVHRAVGMIRRHIAVLPYSRDNFHPSAQILLCMEWRNRAETKYHMNLLPSTTADKLQGLRS